jgi:hypothetical protein
LRQERASVDLSDLDPRLLRLTYASRAADGLSRADLSDIARKAQTKNARLGITGLLLYVDGDFLQILEGPAAPVEAMFELIERDARNKWVTRLATERILRRAFGDWSMGCFEVDAGALDDAHFFRLDAGRTRVRPRFTGDFTIFLDQFYARNRARGLAADFAPAV